MPLLSLFPGQQRDGDWRPTRAAAYGACIGLAAALFKMLGPFSERNGTPAGWLDLGEAVLAFALLCAGAALLRNALTRRFVRGA